ncbi:MAG TPA: PEP-CTERM sorting domain-containing protein [Candidatus Dormibacteraeota bacterium]|nr:PEP-CTERM sorting domain-containing protein [Candidatus Dormibacteraeota bacterium]
MKWMTRLSLLLPLVLFLCAGVTKADGLTLMSYQLAGPVTATFELPASPTILDGNFNLGFGFIVFNPLHLKINGKDSSDFLVFYSAPSGGGAFGAFASTTQPDFSLTGAQLYSDSEKNPTMLEFLTPVTFHDFLGGEGTYTLTVSVPEPPTMILLALGLLFVVFVTKSQIRA